MKRSSSLLSFVAASAILSGSLPAFADDPRHFLQSALEGDNAEIMLGRLAAEKGENPRIQEYGRMLASDHSQAREDVLRVGQRMGVRRSRDVPSEAKDERGRLEQMGGRDFDREFIRFMVRDHQMKVADFRNEVNAGQGPVSELAAQELPALQKHLEMAMDLDRDTDRNGRRMDRDRGDRDPGGASARDNDQMGEHRDGRSPNGF